MELKSGITEKAAGTCAHHRALFFAIRHCPKGTGAGLLRFSPSGGPFCGPAATSSCLPSVTVGTVTSAFPVSVLVRPYKSGIFIQPFRNTFILEVWHCLKLLALHNACQPQAGWHPPMPEYGLHLVVFINPGFVMFLIPSFVIFLFLCCS